MAKTNNLWDNKPKLSGTFTCKKMSSEKKIFSFKLCEIRVFVKHVKMQLFERFTLCLLPTACAFILQRFWSLCWKVEGQFVCMHPNRVPYFFNNKGTPEWFRGWASAFGSGRDPGVQGLSPASGSLHGACFSLCLCLFLFLCVSWLNKLNLFFFFFNEVCFVANSVLPDLLLRLALGHIPHQLECRGCGSCCISAKWQCLPPSPTSKPEFLI